MESQNIQKLLIGIACLGAGASAHFLLSGDAKPQPEKQAVVAPKRERPPAAVQKPPHVRPEPAKPELTPAKVRPPRDEPKPFVPKDRPRPGSKDLQKARPSAC